MNSKRLLGAAAVAALLGGSAWAQTPVAPAETPKPAAIAPTPPVAPTPDAPPAAAPPPSSIVTPPATAPTPIAPATAAGTLAARGDIIDTLKGDARFSTFIKALEVANMTGVLKTNSNLTIFAPTNAAFAALPPGELDRLMKNPAELQRLLTYHVVNTTVDEAKIRGSRGGVKTVAGTELIIDGSTATLKANTATIVQTDVKTTNGTIHVVDGVLTPASAPAVAATTGATRDAAATVPAAPAKPAAPIPPSTPATPPPTADDSATAEDPMPPKDPADPADPLALTCQAPPAAGLTPAQKRSVQEMADESRSAKPDDLAAPPATQAYGAEAYGADVATYEPMPMPRIVTNGPVPDTAENRARYGAPMSRAGKRTAPAGN